MQQADAEQAYVQADMRGCETWVSLPSMDECLEAFPDWFKEKIKGMDRPVIEMKKALYGHPKAGEYWEKHCDERLKSVGFEAVPECDSVYWYPGKDLLLTVYVDDLILSGPCKFIAEGWELIRKAGIVIEEPTKPGLYLVCIRHFGEKWVSVDAFTTRYGR